MTQKEELSRQLLSFVTYGKIDTQSNTEYPKAILDLDPVIEKSHSKNQLVWFYAQWCGHCKKMIPLWNDLKSYDHFDCHAIDCDQSMEYVRKYDIKSFPTLASFKKGEHKVFEGVREKDTILEFIT